jgi:hypothetical protein
MTVLGAVQLAVGHGVQDWIAQVGARVESPVTLLREYLDALRALLRGDTVTAAGRYVRLDGVALGWARPEPPPGAPGATTSPSTCTPPPDPEPLRGSRRSAGGGVTTRHPTGRSPAMQPRWPGP